MEYTMLSGIKGDTNTYFYIHYSGMYTFSYSTLAVGASARHLVFTFPDMVLSHSYKYNEHHYTPPNDKEW